MVNFLIIDDHDIIQDGLANLIKTRPHYHVANTFSSGEEAYRFYSNKNKNIDIVFMDITMAGYGGFEATKKILQRNPKQKIIIMSMHDNPLFIEKAIELGATGYLSKNAITQDLFTAIEYALNNKIFISPSLKKVIEKKKFEDKKIQSLTTREIQILKMLTKGKKLTEIADVLNLSKKTIANNISIIKSKLDVETDYELFSLSNKIEITK
ncbi:response regulator transcription factor [Methylophilaceae bacterium]|jgi:two-component system invasion response regulator UvrY|nr:response regulator transcription factor [Methylophilaceae bacterium]